MDTIFKLLFFVGFLGAVALIGTRLHFFFNNKIQSSENGWALLGYTLLLFATYGLLFFGSLLLLVYIYDFLVG